MPDDKLLETSPCLFELRAAFAREAVHAPWPRAQSSAPASNLARAELDLLGLYHSELARVLVRAVTWLERRTTPRGAAGHRLAAFQKRAAGTVAAARDAGAWVPSAVERVARARLNAWPSKFHLARTAFELDPNTENEALLLCVQAGPEA